MPSRPKRPCSYPGCPNLTDGQYCGQHAAIARKQYNKYERAADINKKYGRAWKRIRDRYVSEHPLCEQCLKDGNVLVFRFYNGSEVTRKWKDRSRAESWTAEKREAARQKEIERRQVKWQEQSQ